MFDFAKRDEKVVRKLSVILEAPVEHKEKIIAKALRALWGFGVEQERDRVYREAAWCSQCKGAGYFQLTLFSPLSCCAAHRGYRYEFCSCGRGCQLKKVYEYLGSGEAIFPSHQWVFRRKDREIK